MLLHRLESVSDQTSDEKNLPENDVPYIANSDDEEDEQQTQAELDEARIREFLSAKNLKNVRSDSSRRSSGCFGRRMDRIGSMSSLGCNTIGKYSKKT